MIRKQCKIIIIKGGFVHDLYDLEKWMLLFWFEKLVLKQKIISKIIDGPGYCSALLTSSLLLGGLPAEAWGHLFFPGIAHISEGSCLAQS